jgi:hypothetical protein
MRGCCSIHAKIAHGISRKTKTFMRIHTGSQFNLMIDDNIQLNFSSSHFLCCYALHHLTVTVSKLCAKINKKKG